MGFPKPQQFQLKITKEEDFADCAKLLHPLACYILSVGVVDRLCMLAEVSLQLLHSLWSWRISSSVWYLGGGGGKSTRSRFRLTGVLCRFGAAKLSSAVSSLDFSCQTRGLWGRRGFLSCLFWSYGGDL
ncbi:unnamed protein product [Microthlaspi erraticum]|uniref:Uncharacterized protein n=1 Tax=Microthlaspi erraticum TaxID=1685480 RepID=A0A6D2LE23_9BRAS|nr:unnamed protein product [Microthlaspi erraticum]